MIRWFRCFGKLQKFIVDSLVSSFPISIMNNDVHCRCKCQRLTSFPLPALPFCASESAAGVSCLPKVCPAVEKWKTKNFVPSHGGVVTRCTNRDFQLWSNCRRNQLVLPVSTLLSPTQIPRLVSFPLFCFYRTLGLYSALCPPQCV